jgi:hypothetical protein
MRALYRRNDLKRSDFDRAKFAAKTIKPKMTTKSDSAEKADDLAETFGTSAFVGPKYRQETQRLIEAIHDGDPAEITKATYKALWHMSDGEEITGEDAANRMRSSLMIQSPLGDISRSKKTSADEMDPADPKKKNKQFNEKLAEFAKLMRESGHEDRADKFLAAHAAYVEAVNAALAPWKGNEEIAGESAEAKAARKGKKP